MQNGVLLRVKAAANYERSVFSTVLYGQQNNPGCRPLQRGNVLILSDRAVRNA